MFVMALEPYRVSCAVVMVRVVVDIKSAQAHVTVYNDVINDGRGSVRDGT